jgi:DNA-binding GntR family transcriptional regulator
VPNPHKSDTSKERIYQELRRSIVLGQLKPGEKINLDSLALTHETSVTPVREALQMLVQEELVTAKPHLGYFVTQITLKELTDLLELRQILELAAIERAAPKITDQQLEQLEKTHLKPDQQILDNYERAVNENREFHYHIALASGNQELAEAVGRVHDRLASFFVFIHSPEEVMNRHQLVIQALEAHDISLAKKTLLNEIKETRDFTLSHVIEKDGATWYIGSGEPTESKGDQDAP